MPHSIHCPMPTATDSQPSHFSALQSSHLDALAPPSVSYLISLLPPLSPLAEKALSYMILTTFTSGNSWPARQCPPWPPAGSRPRSHPRKGCSPRLCLPCRGPFDYCGRGCQGRQPPAVPSLLHSQSPNQGIPYFTQTDHRVKATGVQYTSHPLSHCNMPIDARSAISTQQMSQAHDRTSCL